VVARRVAREIAISRFVADHIGVDSVVVPNGVPGLPLGPHDERTVLVAQRLEAEKETDVALRAWAASGLGSRGWRMIVAGRGALKDDLRGFAVELGVDQTVELAGFDDDLHATMARAGILLATAPAEPFGLTVVEAMACGLPVVAAAGGAHLETAGAAVPESLFPPGDAAAAAERLVRLADDAELRRAEGQRLRDHQRAHLSIDTHVDRLLAVYEDVLGH
jgi:glycosyltransferase involved in cell wall biosynthesis